MCHMLLQRRQMHMRSIAPTQSLKRNIQLTSRQAGQHTRCKGDRTKSDCEDTTKIHHDDEPKLKTVVIINECP